MQATMRQYDFESGSHFFEEIITFSLPLIGLLALTRFPEVKNQVAKLVARVNVQAKSLNLPSGRIANIVIPDRNAVLGKVVSSTLTNSQRFTSEVQEGGPISTISYVDIDLVSPEPGRRVKKPIPLVALPPIAQVTIGSAYERVKDSIETKWGADPHSWPPILQYFRHCRNAALHGNHFNVRPYGSRPGIDPSAPPSWRSSMMPDDATMDTRQLIGDWLDIGDVPILLGDVHELLKTSGVSP